MTKGLGVYFPSPMFSKIPTFLYFSILSHLFSFWNLSLPSSIPPSPSLFFPTHHCSHKLYPQSKIILNVWTVFSRAVFCSNTVLTTTRSSMQFFSFFNMLPKASTTTGMTLQLLMYYFLLIALYSSWYLSRFSFSLSLILRYSNINYGTASLILIHCNNSRFPCLHLSVTLDHNISFHKSSLLLFFTSFQVVLPTQFTMNYSWNIIVLSLVLIFC